MLVCFLPAAAGLCGFVCEAVGRGLPGGSFCGGSLDALAVGLGGDFAVRDGVAGGGFHGLSPVCVSVFVQLIYAIQEDEEIPGSIAILL